MEPTIEPTEYEQCLDLMSFYEVYCSPESGVIEGSADGWIITGCMVAMFFIVAAIIKGNKKETHRPVDDEFDIFS